MIAYKFLCSNVLDAVLSGSVRIGTFEDFRNVENADQARTDAGRSDPDEGVEAFRPDKTTLRGEEVAKVHASMGAQVPEGITVTFAEGAGLTLFTDAYVFCASKSINQDMKRRMHEQFGSDRYVIISDFDAYVHALNECQPISGRKLCIKSVQYVAGKITSEAKDWKGPNPFEKNSVFAWQDEIRAIWSPNDLRPKRDCQEPLILDCPDAAALLEFKDEFTCP